MTKPLPAGWSWLPLEHFASLEPNAITDGPFGSNLKTVDYVDGGEVRVIRLGNIGVGRFVDDDQSFVSASKFSTLQKHEACPGDLVVAALAEPVGRCVEVPDHLGLAMVKADCIRVRVNAAFDRRYLMHALNSPGGRSRAEAAAHGMGRLRMNLADLRSLLVPTAPPGEQRRIVAKLEALQARSRRAREALDAVPPLLETLRQSILAAAFRGDLTKDWRGKHKDVEPASKLLERIRAERRKKWEETELAKMKAKGKAPADDKWKAKYDEPKPVDVRGLPKLPEGWCWASVDELTWSHDGRRVPVKMGDRSSRAGPYPYYGAFGVIDHVDGYLFDATLVLIAEDGKNLMERKRPISLVANGKYWVNNHAHVLEPLGSLPHRYLSEFFNSVDLRARLTGIDQVKLTVSALATLPVPIAPPAEREELTRRVETGLARVANLHAQQSALVRITSHLDAALLAAAFRGELIPQDPNDEPAEAMLARLRGTNGTFAHGSMHARRAKPSRAGGTSRAGPNRP